MATYPDDAVVSSTAYTTLVGGTSTVSYSGSGAITLPINVTYAAQVILTNSTGTIIPVITYYLSATNQISFTTGNAPPAGNYDIKCVDLPAFYRVITTSPTYTVASVRYYGSNVTVQGNTYTTNGTRTTFSLPESVLGTVNNKDFILVSNNGLVVAGGAYTYPSPTLGTNGITFGTAPVANTSIEIRASTTAQQYTTRFTDMRYRKPSNGYDVQSQFNVSKWSSQAGYEKRRLMSRRAKRSYQLSYTNVTGVERQAIENFYNARNGEYETFTFDLTHINQTGTVRTRFNGPLDIQQVFSKGTNITDNYYNIKFNLQEDFD